MLKNNALNNIILPKFKGKVFLAPMAGITDIAFRELCVEYGASLTVTELISARAILQKNKKTFEMLKKAEKEKPFSIQLFGEDAKILADAAKIIEPMCDIIDINMGCPANKVMKIGAGSALLSNPKKCGEIVREIINVVKKPVSVKIRLGVDEKYFTGIEVAKECEKAGASFITVHGRFSSQQYSGIADWKKILEIKKSVKIPVVGNGDLTASCEAEIRRAVNFLAEKSVDFIAIGRGASGNPFIFKQINDYILTGKYNEVTIKDRKKAFYRYLELAQKYEVNFLHQKLQAQHFIKGLVGAPKIRDNISKTKNQDELKEILNNFFSTNQL
jgi:tRNA-dihydrouridine synthase B